MLKVIMHGLLARKFRLVATALAVHNGFARAGGFNTQATTYDWSSTARARASSRQCSTRLAGHAAGISTTSEPASSRARNISGNRRS